MRDPPQIVRLFESSFKRFLDKALRPEDLREDFRWRRERRRCERRGMSCLRLEIFLAKKLARRMSSKKTRHLSRRKGSARARNPKKLRGGVTRRRLSQLTQQELFTALQLLPADVVKQIGKRHPLLIPPFTNDTLRRAVQDYLAGGARKEDIVKKYGEINNWDVSKVTNMSYMFRGARSFTTSRSTNGTFYDSTFFQKNAYRSVSLVIKQLSVHFSFLYLVGDTYTYLSYLARMGDRVHLAGFGRS